MKAKKIIVIVGVIGLIVVGGWAFFYNAQKSAQENVTYETTKLFRADIRKTVVATGEVKPRETIEIKPNISGVISELAVEEGESVEVGQLIAQIQVIPNVGSLNNARQMINSAQITLQNETRNYTWL